MNKLPLIAPLTFVALDGVGRLTDPKPRASTPRSVVIAGSRYKSRGDYIGLCLRDTTNCRTPDKLASRGSL
jgi:hypothetical protein